MYNQIAIHIAPIFRDYYHKAIKWERLSRNDAFAIEATKKAFVMIESYEQLVLVMGPPKVASFKRTINRGKMSFNEYVTREASCPTMK
jgi:hypothetical protein